MCFVKVPIIKILAVLFISIVVFASVSAQTKCRNKKLKGRKCFTISGKTVDSQNNVVPDVRVTVSREASDFSGTSSANGGYTVEFLPSDVIEINARNSSWFSFPYKNISGMEN